MLIASYHPYNQPETGKFLPLKFAVFLLPIKTIQCLQREISYRDLDNLHLSYKSVEKRPTLDITSLIDSATPISH